MNVQTGGIAVMGLLLMTGVSGAEGVESSARPTLVVRTYPHSNLRPKDIADAREYTDRAFREAGVTLTWVDCGIDAQRQVDAGGTCSRTPASNEVVLRIRPAGPADRTPRISMGVALVNAGGPLPLFSTVFADRVALAARAAGVDPRRVLGYAIAHELGHLLLNDPRHSATGLMRAVWSGIELRRNTEADWSFTPAEASLILEAVEGRSRTSAEP